MNLREFFERIKNDDTYYQIIMAKSVKDEHTPFYHYEYNDHYSLLSKVDRHEQCLNKSEDLKKYIVLKPNQQVIDLGRVHTNWVKGVVITTKEEVAKQLVEPQLSHWLNWVDEQVRKEMSNYGKRND